MTDKTRAQQLIIAFTIAALLLVLLLISAYIADRVDGALGHGPLPSGLGSGRAFLATLLAGAMAAVSGGATLVGLRQAKYSAPQQAWVVYALVALPLVVLLLVPLQLYGAGTFVGLPDWLVGVPGRMVLAVTVGALLLGGIDIRALRVGGRVGRIGGSGGGSGTRMAGVSGRFTSSASRVLSYMQEEARRFDHTHMSTEHLMLGILREPRCVATRALANLGIDQHTLRSQIENVIMRRGALYTGGTGMTRRTQRVIEQAAKQARQERSRVMSSGHLLLGLIESGEDVTGQLLHQQGLTKERVAAELRRIGSES